MKNTFLFRPLRRVKKTGKIVVASYQQWRNFKLADYKPLSLMVDVSYREMNHSEQVHNHKGELLYFYTYKPSEIAYINNDRLINYLIDEEVSEFDTLLHDIEMSQNRCIVRSGWHTMFNCKGLDCDGVPTFSHLTQDEVASNYKNMDVFEPLTVATVIEWYAWILESLRAKEIFTK